MTAAPAGPAPLDCLRRGLRSLRANWELVPLLMARGLLTTGLMLAGLLILLAALGVGVVAWLRGLEPGWSQRLVEDLATSLEVAPPELLPLVAPLLAATLVWTLAFGLHCYLQGGVVGTLVAGEMAAGAGLPGWRSFRRFSLAGFDRRGRLLFWRYFWFYNLLGAVASVWGLLALGLVALALRLATGGGTEAGVAVGCVGLVPLGLLLVAAILWSLLATVEVARPGAGVWAASRRALDVLWRRLGTLLAIGLAALAAGLVVSAAFTPLGWAVAAAGDSLVLWLSGRGALLIAQTLVGGVFSVALIATLAALVGLPPASAREGSA